MTAHPGIDEYDVGSWLDGSLSEHDVLRAWPDGSLNVDGAPSFRSAARDTDSLNIFNGVTHCEPCSFDAARELGYEGPTEIPVAYQRTHPREPEQVMVLRDDLGNVISIASYAYGRAYFEPGEPRTDPCSRCGAETLRENESWTL